jgi:putative ABC transport system permease protein
MVWGSQITVPPEYGNLDLLVVDPVRFAEVANWGTGPELARAREKLHALAVADVQVAARQRAGGRKDPIPALGVGAVLQRPGDQASVSSTRGNIPITVMDVVPAFPGISGELPVIVVPADSFFSYQGTSDPRVRPPDRSGAASVAPVEYFPSLWSSVNLSSLQAILTSHQVVAQNIRTYEAVEQTPDLVAARDSTGYQVALGLCVAGLALLGLSMFADRSVTRARAADLMLTRMGMGRGGTGRARALELTAFTAISLLLAGGGAGVWWRRAGAPRRAVSPPVRPAMPRSR